MLRAIIRPIIRTYHTDAMAAWKLTREISNREVSNDLEVNYPESRKYDPSILLKECDINSEIKYLAPAGSAEKSQQIHILSITYNQLLMGQAEETRRRSLELRRQMDQETVEIWSKLIKK